MEIRSETADGFSCIYLEGRLDIAGTQSVDLKVTTLTSTKREPVMVDITEVDFISSIGIRMLATNAKTLNGYGARMVLVNPQKAVLDVLQQAGLELIPIAGTSLDAATILKGASG